MELFYGFKVTLILFISLCLYIYQQLRFFYAKAGSASNSPKSAMLLDGEPNR